MFHMYAIPTSASDTYHSDRFRMAYLTNTESDQSGSGRAIHSHADIAEIALVYSGSGIHSIDRRQYNSGPGDLLLYNANVLHQDLSASEEPVRFFLCGISGLQLSGQLSGVISADPDCFLLKSSLYSDFLLRGFEMLEHGIRERSPHIAPMAHGFLRSLLAIISELSTDTNHNTAAPRSEELPLSEKIRRYIDYNYTSNFSLAELADELHVSRYHASHIFSETFGTSIIHYRTLRRIGEAQSLLTSTDASVTHIASVVGYDDPNQFSQTFAKIVGMPPSKYRNLSVWSRRSHKKD